MTRDSLSATRREVEEQPSRLARLLSRPLEPAKSGSIFVGAGDSYSASLAVFYLTEGRYPALDPYALESMPASAAGRDVFFISVSGRTSANISAARRLRGVASRRIAITADPKGPLAKEVDEVVPIPYEPGGRVSGTLSFSLTLLTSLKLVLGEFPCDFRSLFSSAKLRGRRVAFSGRGTTYFLGNNAMYPSAIYAAAKLYELLGARSQAEQLEEFSHMELFSLRGSDSVVIFSAFDPAHLGEKLHAALQSRGYKSSLHEPQGSNAVETLFYYTFLGQMSALERAKAIGLSEPYFAGAKKKLRISDDLIY